MGVCDKAPLPTSPINIVTSVGPCDLKCHYSYNYPQMKLIAYNRGEYLDFIPNKVGSQNITKTPVSYNNNWYDVEDVRIYSPSLHQYGGKKTAAELVIIHSGMQTSRPLMVCVPIQQGGKIEGTTGNLDALVSTAVTSTSTGSLGTGVPVDLTSFTLNDLIPTKSFFSYSGTLPYSPCQVMADFVVFNIENALSISSATYGRLSSGKYITNPEYPIRSTDGRLFFNKAGALKGLTSAEGEGIYIDCQPTGEVGQTLVAVDTGFDVMNSPLIKTLMSIGTQVLVGAMIMGGLWYIGTLVVSSAKKAGGAGGGTMQAGGSGKIPRLKRGSR